VTDPSDLLLATYHLCGANYELSESAPGTRLVSDDVSHLSLK
jgi:hypothetical protein